MRRPSGTSSSSTSGPLSHRTAGDGRGQALGEGDERLLPAVYDGRNSLSEAQASPDSVSARRPHLADEPRGGEGNVREGHGNVNRIEGVSHPSFDERPADANA